MSGEGWRGGGHDGDEEETGGLTVNESESKCSKEKGEDT